MLADFKLKKNKKYKVILQNAVSMIDAANW